MSRKPQPPAREAEKDQREQLSLLVPLKPAAPLAPRAPEPALAPPLPAPAPPPAPRIYSVTELLRAARATLESRFVDVRVEGEISGLKRSGPGHIYFCLKDEEGQLDCVLFARESSRLKFELKEGMAVRCRGRLTLYEARGKFQMTLVDIEPTGAGALALAFEQLKQRLGAAGLFDAGRKRPQPFLPRRLGVVTSPQGAVVRDIIRIAHRRFPLPIVVSPTPVQGDGAALAIASALRRIEAMADVDVVIVARGGGSLEDLWAFNEEPVARAIFACRVPVISAVGHETDFTIADFVADLRAATPSAAAERVVQAKDALLARVTGLERRSSAALRLQLARVRARVEATRAHRVFAAERGRLQVAAQHVDDLVHRAGAGLLRRTERGRDHARRLRERLAGFGLDRQLAVRRERVETRSARLSALAREQAERRRAALGRLTASLDGLSPLAVLSRGYAVVFEGDGARVLRDAAETAPGARLRIRLARGGLRATVESREDE